MGIHRGPRAERAKAGSVSKAGAARRRFLCCALKIHQPITKHSRRSVYSSIRIRHTGSFWHTLAPESLFTKCAVDRPGFPFSSPPSLLHHTLPVTTAKEDTRLPATRPGEAVTARAPPPIELAHGLVFACSTLSIPVTFTTAQEFAHCDSPAPPTCTHHSIRPLLRATCPTTTTAPRRPCRPAPAPATTRHATRPRWQPHEAAPRCKPTPAAHRTPYHQTTRTSPRRVEEPCLSMVPPTRAHTQRREAPPNL